MDHDSWSVACNGDPSNLKLDLWGATEDAYQDAMKTYLMVKGNASVKTSPEDASADFSREEPVQFLGQPASVAVDRGPWEAKLRTWSAMFRKHPEIETGIVTLHVEGSTRYIVTSEGTRVQRGRTWVRLGFWASAHAADGMELRRYDAIDVGALDRLPGDAEVRARIQKVIDDVLALRAAPAVDAYVG